MGVDIGYANARARGRKSYFFTPAFYQELLQAYDEEEVIAKLLKTHYRQSIEQGLIRASGIKGAEEGLKIEFIREVQEIRSWIPPALQEIFDLVIERWDIFNLKAILRGKHFGATNEEIIESLFPAGHLSKGALEFLAMQASIREVIDALATWGSHLARPLTENFKDYAENRNLALLELALDKYYYQYIFSRLRKKRDLNQQLTVEMIRREIDLVNLMTILKTRREQLDPETVQDFFIPGGKFITEEHFAKLAEVREVEDVNPLLEKTPYRIPLEAGVKEFLKTDLISMIERKMEEYMLKKLIDLFRADPLSMAIIIAYLWSKYNEVVNLRIILRGKAVGMSEQAIREALVIV